MDSSFLLGVLVFGVVVLAVFVYVLFMIFLPEWVGITGKEAKKNMAAHQSETPNDSGPGAAKP